MQRNPAYIKNKVTFFDDNRGKQSSKTGSIRSAA